MIKKSLTILGVSAFFFSQAQNVSVLRNTTDVYNTNGLPGTAKYNAMAGSIGALGGDASSALVNPAGIGVAISGSFSGTLNISNINNKSTLAGASKEYSINKTNLGNIGGIATFQLLTESPWKFVNVAVNYSSKSLEDYVETPGNSNLTYNIPATSDVLTYSGHAFNRYGTVDKTNIAIGANYDNQIYVGAGLNFHGAKIDQYDTAAFYSSNNKTTDVYDKQDTPYTESSTGFSANIGIIGKVSQEFRLGAALETPTWWTINRVYNYYESPSDGTAAEDRKLSTPMKATLSAAMVPSKNFAVNVDYTIGLGKSKYKVYGGAERELNDFYNNYSQTTSEIKIGAEYRVKNFRLRGGYGYESNPLKPVSLTEMSVNGNLSDKSYSNLLLGNRNTLGLGIGYDFGPVYLDFAYQNVSSEYKNPFLKGDSAYNAGYFSSKYVVEYDGSLVSNVKRNLNNYSLTLGWKF
jgi:hypothetical protein